MASVSSHLRNYNSARLIGFLGILDSHPEIKGMPLVSTSPAKYQQTQGTTLNPFTHVTPCHLLLNKKDIKDFFNSTKAKSVIDTIFSMGVMAPNNWRDLDGFKLNETENMKPSQVNIVDNLNEKYHHNDGLVNALVVTTSKAVKYGSWEASGVHQHNSSSLEDFIYQHYYYYWKPYALGAYAITSNNLQEKQQQAKKSNSQDQTDIIQQRIDIIDEQRKVLQEGTVNIKEIVRTLISDTVDEKWE
jgi:hypothetical protein